MSLTVDASVFVAASRADELHYIASRQFSTAGKSPALHSVLSDVGYTRVCGGYRQTNR